MPPASPQDVQATLLEFTAASVAAAIRRHAPGAAVYVCGGGAHNRGLLAALAPAVGPGSGRAAPAVLGLDPDYVEAVAFAWFAHRTLAGLPSSAASVTGARGAADPRRHLSPCMTPMNDTDLHAPRLYINRELSFLEFNQRVLEQAKDRGHPAARAGQVPVHLAARISTNSSRSAWRGSRNCWKPVPSSRRPDGLSVPDS